MVADKYRIDEVIGEGGMGIVVAATHVALDQRVAIKFLLPEARRSAEVVERFLREARVAARVNSDHVARVSDVGTMEDGTPFLVMEHLVGADLGGLLHTGPLPLEEACEIALQACEALAQVHAAGVVHRDLKPSNLFVTRRADGSPCVKLLDFGISKLTDASEDGSDAALTSTAAIMGSPSYMSPEQLQSTKGVDARTDVWSLGVVLYEAVTGRVAFRRETVPQVFAMIASEEPAAPSSLRDDLPKALEQAIFGCLVKDAQERFTLVDLARGLVPFAPARAEVSLERIEAMLGAESRALPAASRRQPSRAALQATTARSALESSARATPPGSRRAGSRWRLLLALAALAALGLAVGTGRIDLTRLRGRVESVSSAVAAMPPMPPLSSVMAPIASVMAPVGSVIAPIASALAEPTTDDDDAGSDLEAAAPSSAAASASGVRAAGPSAPQKPATTKQGGTHKPAGPAKVRRRHH
jgi:serine/threonine-protein kinase